MTGSAAWARKRYKVMWGCRDDGTFLSLTYLKKQEVYGWARHDTLGLMVSVNAVTETGALVIASASGSQLPGYAGGAARAIWVVGAQKVVPDLGTALRRIEDYVLPLESARVQVAYGGPSAVNRVLILNAEPHPGRGSVLLLREAIGY